MRIFDITHKRIQYFSAVMTAYFWPFVDFFQTAKHAQNLRLTKKTGEGKSLPPFCGMEGHSLSPKYGKLAAAVTPTSDAEVSCSGPSSVGT